jgi:hypothetical protein
MTIQSKEVFAQPGSFENPQGKTSDGASAKGSREAFDHQKATACDLQLQIHEIPSNSEIEKKFKSDALNLSTLLKDGLSSGNDDRAAQMSAMKDSMQRVFDFAGLQGMHKMELMINDSLKNKGSQYNLDTGLLFFHGDGCGGGSYEVDLLKGREFQAELCRVKTKSSLGELL